MKLVSLVAPINNLNPPEYQCTPLLNQLTPTMYIITCIISRFLLSYNVDMSVISFTTLLAFLSSFTHDNCVKITST